ncbi:MAG: DUF6452 family protein [Bacteroides sp.]|jgi:hypothetical protein|nr:DUF6452 family protein [Bacteroides sp.]
MKVISGSGAMMVVACLLSMLFLGSCQSDELCEEATSNPLRLGFYLPTVIDGAPTAYTVDSLTVYGAGRADSLIYDNTKSVRSIEVPLNPASTNTGFVFIFPENITDTLWVEYTHSLNFVSAECGFTMFYDILEVSHTNYRISTVQLSQNLLNHSLEEHIKILLYPDADL